MHIFKSLAARLPKSMRTELKRLHYRNLIARNKFLADEPEFEILGDLVRSGDWVIDLGANIGHFTLRLSEIVGSKGRVISLEPHPDSFMFLSEHSTYSNFSNITLLNVAASDYAANMKMAVPKLDTGLDNYYMARISDEGDISVLTWTVDSLALPHRISLIKIDVEGHELQAINGARKIIEKDMPVLIVETRSDHVCEEIKNLGYSVKRMGNSPNLLCKPMHNSRDLKTRNN